MQPVTHTQIIDNRSTLHLLFIRTKACGPDRARMTRCVRRVRTVECSPSRSSHTLASIVDFLAHGVYFRSHSIWGQISFMDNVWVQVNRHGADVVVESGNVKILIGSVAMRLLDVSSASCNCQVPKRFKPSTWAGGEDLVRASIPFGEGSRP